MASCADWRNLQQTHTNATVKSGNKPQNASPPKDRKH